MRKFWIVLLAMGLVAGFAMSASAADVKFSGQYYVYGIYVDNPTFTKDVKTANVYYHQRLRMQTDFKIAEGLSLVTRFDALEKAWGYKNSADGWRGDAGYGGGSFDVTNRSSQGAAGARTQENIEFEHAYIDFTTKIGRFNVGYQNFFNWGTVFLNSDQARAGIKYFIPVGPLTIVAAIEKGAEQGVGAGYRTDADNNIYDLGAIYKFGAGDAGILYQYNDTKNTRALGYKTQMHIINPYARMKFGPVYIEAEGVYGFGKWVDSEVSAIQSVDAQALGLYLNAKADIGPAYVGGIFAYMSGDDIKTTDKKEGTFAFALVAGQTWDPCLIIWNNALYSGEARQVGTGLGVFFDNAYMVQVYGGFKPTKASDIMLSVTWAKADQDYVANQVSKDIGWEIDLMAKYKIFDNLEYMAGAGYLLAGDWFKGANSAAKIDNNYMLIHKLTLSF